MTEMLRDQVRGRWQDVLVALGVPSRFLNGKHQPCPVCGGKDRARWDNKDGAGTWFCTHCGAGDGFALLMKMHKWDFRTTAERIEALVGSARRRPIPVKLNGSRQRDLMHSTWRCATQLGLKVRKYLLSRNINPEGVTDLRENDEHDMLALVRGPDDRGCMIHRTLLTPDGHRKARLFMEGTIPDGAAVQLMPCGVELGVGEGIETSLSAAQLFGLPCWAALNTTLMRKFEPPERVKYLVIFGDNDVNFSGQAAAYALAFRLSTRPGLKIEVKIPDFADTDWNDVLRQRCQLTKAAALRQLVEPTHAT